MDQNVKTQVRLRPAQEAILAYEGGLMAVSAVPGSGKTFTLSLLAAQLIAAGGGSQARLDIDAGQQILIVTYLNSSVDTFKARIRQRLNSLGRPPELGFEVRTLHSLSLEIVRAAEGDWGEGISILDEVQSGVFLGRAVDSWIEDNVAFWSAFLEDDSPAMRIRWRNITEYTARAYIRMAKNERYQPDAIFARFGALNPAEQSDSTGVEFPLVPMLNGIYGRYQAILDRQGVLDFDDLIWRAVDLLEQRPGLAEQLRFRWPYVLEDEAQDSVPLQERLLQCLVGDGQPGANWVRVGDPNQAITSSFTAAHPRYFNAFSDRPDVISRPLPNSGRNAPLIIEAANRMLDWAVSEHPVAEVRKSVFRRQHIVPAPPGDAQPNPPDSEADVRIKVYRHREEEELPQVAGLAHRYSQQFPDRTVAVLVPTNQIGHFVADLLDARGVAYDNLLRGGRREREIAAVIVALLTLLGDPLDRHALADVHQALLALDHPVCRLETEGSEADLKRFQALLASIHTPELLLFPGGEATATEALPVGVATASDLAEIERLTAFLRRIFALRPLPVDDLILALGDELFLTNQPSSAPGDQPATDLAIAYQIANVLREWRDLQPGWRLPELAAELAEVANGRRNLSLAGPDDLGFEPVPGRITLCTQHSAKGLEWDAVFLVGIDDFWIPNTLDGYFQGVHGFLGGDPAAEALAQLRYLMQGESGLFPDRNATESAHIEIIGERLRLLYVGITRARRFLQISRSQTVRQGNRERETGPTNVLGSVRRGG